MIKSLRGQLNDWEYGRGIIKQFITGLSGDDLDKKLPRKSYNTIRLHCGELAWIQSCYVAALSTRKISFNWVPVADMSKDGLLSAMEKLDSELVSILDGFIGDEEISWHESSKNIHEHISAMIGHEQMHIGQIIAFCYATGIHIPNEIAQKMALDG